MAATEQAYAYTGGNPTNLTDPSGLAWSIKEGAAGSIYFQPPPTPTPTPDDYDLLPDLAAGAIGLGALRMPGDGLGAGGGGPSEGVINRIKGQLRIKQVAKNNRGQECDTSIPDRGRFDFDFDNIDRALTTAQQIVGDLGVNTWKMYDPRTGTLIGEKSADGLRGWRIDAGHVNYWDWTENGGKKGTGGLYGHLGYPEEQTGPHSVHTHYAEWER